MPTAYRMPCTRPALPQLTTIRAGDKGREATVWRQGTAWAPTWCPEHREPRRENEVPLEPFIMRVFVNCCMDRKPSRGLPSWAEIKEIFGGTQTFREWGATIHEKRHSEK
jgi:hypothetical protein